jgi:23S rRNA (guanosine2251-2'-O)-methyltransferase
MKPYAKAKGKPHRPPDRHGARDPARAKEDPSVLWLYGRHAVAAALANPARRIRRGFATKNAADWLSGLSVPADRLSLLEDARPDAIDRLLPAGAVHQGLAIETHDLDRARLKEVCDPEGALRPVVVLDQITDPQNIGAIFRTAAAFGARAAIVQERRTPPLSGALAKAAAGAVETLPCVKVVNISRALEALSDLGYYCAGLAGDAGDPITALPKGRPIALVLGAEGAGLRQLVGATCNGLYKIPIDASMESLNVSNAAAISLYEATRGTLD